jgi:hypothetical protein
MVRLPKGTKEFLVVVVVDKLQTLTDLSTATAVTFDVVKEDGTNQVSDINCDTDGMAALCLVDTTTWDEAEYQLFVNVSTGVQNVILGPFRFEVENYALTV